MSSIIDHAIKVCEYMIESAEALRELFDEFRDAMYQLAKEIEDELPEFVPWDEIHDYPEFPPGALGVPLARLPTSRKFRKWRVDKYGRF